MAANAVTDQWSFEISLMLKVKSPLNYHKSFKIQFLNVENGLKFKLKGEVLWKITP